MAQGGHAVATNMRGFDGPRGGGEELVCFSETLLKMQGLLERIRADIEAEVIYQGVKIE